MDDATKALILNVFLAGAVSWGIYNLRLAVHDGLEHYRWWRERGGKWPKER